MLIKIFYQAASVEGDRPSNTPASYTALYISYENIFTLQKIFLCQTTRRKEEGRPPYLYVYWLHYSILAAVKVSRNTPELSSGSYVF